MTVWIGVALIVILAYRCGIALIDLSKVWSRNDHD